MDGMLRIINNNSFSRRRIWDLEKLRDLTQAHLAFRGRTLFGQCPKCLAFSSDAMLITTKIYSPESKRTYIFGLCNPVRVALLSPLHRFKTQGSERSTDMPEELIEKVGLTPASSAQETESVPSNTLPVLQLELHSNILSASPLTSMENVSIKRRQLFINHFIQQIGPEYLLHTRKWPGSWRYSSKNNKQSHGLHGDRR